MTPAKPNRWRRIYIVPTFWGIGAITLLLIVTLYGVWSASPAMVAMGLLFSILTLITTVQTNQNLMDIDLVSLRSEGVAAGAEANLHIVLRNSGKDARYGLQLVVKLKGTRTKFTASSTVVGSKGSEQVSIPIATSRRGVFPIERITVQSRFPLGIFVAWRWQAVEHDLIVYPRPLGLQLSETNAAQENLDKVGLAAASVGSDDYSEHRDYQLGDSQRHIDWKAHARGRPLLVKVFADKHTTAHRFRFTKTQQKTNEARLEQLSKWVDDAVTADEAFALELPDATLGMGRGYIHLERARELLAKCQVGDKDAA